MGILKGVDRLLMRLELAVAILAMTGVVVILVAQVFCRYVLLSPLFFAEELALVLLIVATFTGLSLIVAEDRLITVDLLGGMVSPGIHRKIAWAMRVTVCGLGATLAFYALRYIATPWVWSERSATLNMPRAALYAVVSAELCLLVFHQGVRVIESFPWRRNGEMS